MQVASTRIIDLKTVLWLSVGMRYSRKNGYCRRWEQQWRGEEPCWCIGRDRSWTLPTERQNTAKTKTSIHSHTCNMFTKKIRVLCFFTNFIKEPLCTSELKWIRFKMKEHFKAYWLPTVLPVVALMVTDGISHIVLQTDQLQKWTSYKWQHISL